MISKTRDLLNDTAEKISKEIWYNVILPDYTVDQQDSNSDTDLMCACYIGDVNIVKKLIELNANVNLINDTGLNCILLTIWHCVGFGQEAGIEILELLAKAGAELNLQDVEGQTGLIISCTYKNMEDITEKLIDLGVDLNIQTKNGSTALTFACERNFLKCMYLLCTKIDKFKTQIKSIKHNKFATKANIILKNVELNIKLNKDLKNKINSPHKIKI